MSSVPDYQGGVGLNHHLIMFLRYMFKNQIWSDESVFKWSESEADSSVEITAISPEKVISRPTIVVGYPDTSNPLVGFNSMMGMDPGDTDIIRTYNFEYDIDFLVRAFTVDEVASLADLTFLTLTHPQFCTAFELATNIRPDVRKGNFTKSKVNVRLATGVKGSSGSFEYEIAMRGKYIVTMDITLDYIDVDTIAKEVVAFIREE